MSVLAHLGGFPIEETLASAGPALLVAFGAASANFRASVRRVRARAGAGGRTVSSAAIATLAGLTGISRRRRRSEPTRARRRSPARSATRAGISRPLEIQTPADCFPFAGIATGDPDPSDRVDPPDNGQVQWPYADPELQCPPTYGSRGTSSGDPDGDIVSWSIDFGNGTQASARWNSGPPGEVSHAYPCGGGYPAPLVVIDSAGESDTDTGFLDVTPD